MVIVRTCQVLVGCLVSPDHLQRLLVGRRFDSGRLFLLLVVDDVIVARQGVVLSEERQVALGLAFQNRDCRRNGRELKNDLWI